MRMTAALRTYAAEREIVLRSFLNTTIFPRRIGHLSIDRRRRQCALLFAGRTLELVASRIGCCRFRFVGRGIGIRESRGKFIEDPVACA
jgi:hypothetical protein